MYLRFWAGGDPTTDPISDYDAVVTVIAPGDRPSGGTFTHTVTAELDLPTSGEQLWAILDDIEVAAVLEAVVFHVGCQYVPVSESLPPAADAP